MDTALGLEIYSSALPQHRDAFYNFAQLVTSSAALATEAFDEYASEQPPSPATSAAAAIISKYVEIGADLYTNFGTEVERGCLQAKEKWLQASIASNVPVDKVEAVKRAWRLERIAMFLSQQIAASEAPRLVVLPPPTNRLEFEPLPQTIAA